MFPLLQNFEQFFKRNGFVCIYHSQTGIIVTKQDEMITLKLIRIYNSEIIKFGGEIVIRGVWTTFNRDNVEDLVDSILLYYNNKDVIPPFYNKE